MTKIYLHGILEKEYQKFFCLNLKNASDLIDAIDCNRQGFKARILSLQNKCFFYDIIVNKKRIKSFEDLKEKPKRIDLVPAIAGAGPAIAGFITTTVVPTVTAVTSFIGQTLGAGFSAITGSLGGIGGAGTFGNIAASVGLAAIASVLAPKPDLGLPAQQEISAVANALSESYIFSSKINLAQQGSFLPIGYGRLKVGSAVVQSCIKSFPLIVPDEKALQSNTFISKSTNIDAPISANSFVL